MVLSEYLHLEIYLKVNSGIDWILYLSVYLYGKSLLGCYILFIWVSKNFKFQKSPNLNINEVVKTSTIEETKVKKTIWGQ